MTLFVVGGSFVSFVSAAQPLEVTITGCSSTNCQDSLCVPPNQPRPGCQSFCGAEEFYCETPVIGNTNVDGACSGGTCRLGSCSSGETPSGACTGVSGGTCCKVSNTNSNSTPITFTNPLKYDTVEGVLDSILDTLRNIIVILSLVFIVIGAILYITSAGNDKQMTMAKGAITAAMIGLAIGLAAPSFLKEIGTVLGWDASVNQDALVGAKTLSQIARNVLDFLLSIVGVLAIIMLVVGGIMYLTAAGNEDQLDSGKKIVKYSIIGIAVALASLVIVSQIATFFG